MSILLLTTTGRRTGRSRTNPLTFFADGDDVVVVASNGGLDRSPAWWLNLRRNPVASIEIGRERRPVRARRASREEHARLWAAIVGRFPVYASYQQRTARPIPVVILEPADARHDAPRAAQR
jgi:deazaflavin-dependent oxidoreductase (nitroreductase family)